MDRTPVDTALGSPSFRAGRTLPAELPFLRGSIQPISAVSGPRRPADPISRGGRDTSRDTNCRLLDVPEATDGGGGVTAAA